MQSIRARTPIFLEQAFGIQPLNTQITQVHQRVRPTAYRMTYPDRIIQMNDHGLSWTGWWEHVRYRILAAFIAGAFQSGIHGAGPEHVRDEKYGLLLITDVTMNFHYSGSESTSHTRDPKTCRVTYFDPEESHD